MRFLIAILFIMTPLAVSVQAQDNNDYNCADPQFQQEMNYCAYQDWQNADKQLNAVWKQVKPAYDAVRADTPSDFRAAKNQLLEAQRAWIKFRDAHCESTAVQSAGGTIVPLLVNSCKAAMTNGRTKQLKQLLVN